ncbi:nuclear transport factor 2 family protein [Streptomyces sp. GESEQ-35]|uniref:nuclear transport factor 2 family protein n=1 Tax=Streptomyces sp. GESEQ-35 TaxID=2812657 RepID=UPI001B3193E2|nr:nuclear transport factor 2 family protein [Streptomyces sp. GESEQ-35]
MTPGAGTIAGPALAALLHTELSMLVTALWHEIDHGDGSAAAGFFTSDAELTFSRRTFRGTDEISGVYRDRAARGPRVSRHLLTNFLVLRHESGHVEAVSALMLFAQDGTPPVPATVPVLIADVYDRFVRVGAADEHTSRWRIASRRIENRFLMPGDVLAVPTE